MMNRLSRGVVVGLLASLVVASLGACASPKPAANPADLEGVEWSLTGSSVSSVDLGASGITANFDGKIMSGFSGVNQYTGPYTANSDGSFKVGKIAGTLMAGPEPLMKAESAYLKLLEGCDSFSVANDVLTLSTGGNETLTYEKAKPASLPGTKWNVTGYNNGKQAVTSPAADSTLTVEFGTDGTVSGNGGVNTFNGPFESTEKTVKIGPLASTMMAGPQELMDQEAQYLAALQNATVWTLVQGRLEMRDEAGATQIVAVSQK